ncbi:MAG: hypothetical protein C0391_05805 [Anaerolinea sp.]|nr:hypothetical protein [Anaerolinea sp.]
MFKRLIIAYGNPDRQDDGAGWYVLTHTAAIYGQIFHDYNDDFYSKLGNNPDFFFTLQLVPELVDIIYRYDAVCFVDASVDSQENSLKINLLEAKYQFSPLSHHMSPQTLLDLVHSVHQKSIPAWLLTIPGRLFGFKRELSVHTKAEAEKGVAWLSQWTGNQE